MAKTQLRTLRKAIETALLARDRLEMKAVERLLAAAHLAPRAVWVQRARKTLTRAR